jgi:hypothetical protein
MNKSPPGSVTRTALSLVPSTPWGLGIFFARIAATVNALDDKMYLNIKISPTMKRVRYIDPYQAPVPQASVGPAPLSQTFIFKC